MAQRSHLASLTGLRFLAAFLVLGFHTGWTKLPGLPQPLRNLMLPANYSVSMFFVLSGFILTFNYAHPARSLMLNDRQFWLARAARIYPTYLFALLVAAPFFWVASAAKPPQEYLSVFVGAVSVLFLVQAWAPQTLFLWNYPSWSLSDEAFFYYLFPRIVGPLQRLTRRGLLLAMAAIWLVAQVPPALFYLLNEAPQEDSNWSHFVYGNPILRLPEFLVGMAIGIVFLQDVERNDPPSRRRSLGGWLSTLCALVILGLLLGYDRLPTALTMSQGMLSPLFGLLIYGLALGGGPLDWLLARPTLVLLGEASYALYLLHFPVNTWVVYLMAGTLDAESTPWTLWLTSSLICMLVSLATFKLVEQPAHRALRSWLRETPDKPQA